MRRSPALLLALAAVAGFAAASTSAQAARRHHGHGLHAQFAGHPLTVNKRPFTDSGNVVPVGRETGYVAVGQSDHRQFPGVTGSRYGGETLPGRFENPGAGPLFNF